MPPAANEPPAASAKAPTDDGTRAAGDELDIEASIARYHQLLQRRPFHGPAFTGLVAHHVERDTLPALVAEYDAKATALPDDVAIRIVLARLYLRSGDAAKASELIRTIETLPPALARMGSELLVFKSEVFQRTGDTAAAEAMLKGAMAQATTVSDELRLGEALADLYLTAGGAGAGAGDGESTSPGKDAAVAALEALAAKHPDQYLHQRRIADAMAQRHLFEAAVERYRALLPLVADEVDRRCESLRQLGLALERLSRRDEAIAAYSEAVGLLASDHWLERELHERIVGLYRASNRLDDLAAYCRAQIERAPEQTAMRLLLADVQTALGRSEDAKATLAQAIELFPSDLTLSARRLELLERARDVEGALAEHQRIISRHPDDAELYIAFGQFLAQNRQIDAARNQWQHVLNRHVADAGLANRLGALFEAHELADDAVQAYERAISLAPAAPEGYLALSRLWALRSERDKAVATLERAAAANPDDGAIHAAVASGLLSLNQGEKALEAMRRACELTPGGVRYRQTLADLLVAAGRLEEALRVRREAIDLMTNPVQRAEAIAILVSMHASADRLAELEKAEAERLEAAPADPVALLLLAGAADSRRDFTVQRSWLDRLLAADPGNEAALQSLARLQDATADVDGAVSTWKRLIALHPQRARPAYDAIVDLRLRYGDKAGAIETLEEMVAADPANATVLKGVAEQLQRMGDPERALPYYERSLAVQADRHETRLEYGKALADAGRLEDALAAFRAVATQRGDMDSAIDAMGRLHDTATQLGSLEELIDDLEKSIELDPSNTLAARALGQILVREFEYARALSLFDLVIRNNPRDVDLAIGRAELFRRLAQFDKAIEAYQLVLRQPQIDRDFVLGEMGKAHFESGQVDQAKRLWTQVQNRQYAGSLLRNNGLLDDAVRVYEEGLRLKPDDFGLHRSLIGALEAAGRTEDALAAARRLLDLEPDNAVNIVRVAEAHLRNGDRAGAAEVAARLFSASVLEKKTGTAPGSSLFSNRVNYAYGYYGRANLRTSLDRGIAFFQSNGMLAELGTALEAQMEAQPANAVLRMRAAELFSSLLGKPDRALALWRELETASIPLEHQQWLGQCSQQDSFRMRQYGAIASMPAMRDASLARLGSRKPEELSPDEALELAVIRNAQGDGAAAIELLKGAVSEETGTMMRGALIDMLLAAERYPEAEPLLRAQIEALAAEREQMREQTVERVRREYVRMLPIEWQLRLNEELIRAIADRRTQGSGFIGWSNGGVSPMGHLRANVSLGTVLAKTGRMEEARALWTGLAPGEAPDVDRWTMLGSIAQLHDQSDLAYEYYRSAMKAARAVAHDALLRQIYASSLANSWYDESQAVDASFNRIVAAFAERDGLLDLYDYLRDTDQAAHARRIAEQYDLDERLQPILAARVEEAAAAYRSAVGVDPFERSVGYLAAVCKLAEVHDRRGAWDEAVAAYKAYLEDFPDELQLLRVLGEVAEAQLDLSAAIEWEKRILETKARLARRARQWMSRDLTLTPSVPQALGKGAVDPWEWRSRWRSGGYGYAYGGGLAGGFGGPGLFDRAESWLRLARLYLASDNPIAAGDAMSRAVADAGGDRERVVASVLTMIQERQLAARMLPVLRSLAVSSPNDEKVQLAFAEALEANERPDLAVEVCRRMLRRGVSDLAALAQVRSRLASLAPEDAPPPATLATLEAEVAADPTNLKGRLQLGKAYYYSLDVEKALGILEALAAEAPHIEDVHPLIVEIHTLRNDADRLVAALRTQIERTTDDGKRRAAQWRLVDELLACGRNDEALGLVQTLGDPRDPASYPRITALLHYFGRHDDALRQAEEAKKSQTGARYYGRVTDLTPLSAFLGGDIDATVGRVLASIDEAAQQQVQYGGMNAFYSDGSDPFAAIRTLLLLEPKVADGLRRALEARLAEKPDDPQAAKLLMGLHRSLGRTDLADAILERLVETRTADQTMTATLIDRAMEAKQYDRAIRMAQEFIAAQPRPKLDPGVPAQYAGQMALQSPRSFMACKLGDVYWEMGESEKAFEAYREIVVERADETRMAYALICLARERIDEARTIVDEALAAQQVRSPQLLKHRAAIAILDDDLERAYSCLEEAAMSDAPDPNAMMYGMEETTPLTMLLAFVLQGAQRPEGAPLVARLEVAIRGRIAKAPADWSNYEVLLSLLQRTGQVAKALHLLEEARAVPSLTKRAVDARLALQQGYVPLDTLVALCGESIDIAERAGTVAQAPTRAPMYAMPSPGPSQGSGSARETLGMLHWDRGDADQAHKAWTARRDLKDPSTHAWLGGLYQRLGAKSKAEEHYRAALALDPEHVQAHLGLADLCMRRGDRPEAFGHMLIPFVRQQNASAAQSPQAAQGYSPYSSASQAQRIVDDPRMHEWALAIAAEPGSAERNSAAVVDDTQGRVMLAVLTGDWSALESAVADRVAAGSVDPMAWRLWAQSQARRGAWEEAARAFEFLRRARRTTIADHRTQLELALAGKQVKEAAAGTRQAGAALPGAAALAAQPAYYGYQPDYFRGTDPGTSELAAIYVRLGRFADAERLYLLSAGGSSVAATLPAIAGLLWQQGARDRALELMRLSMVLGDARSGSGLGSGASQYGAMLAEAGQADAAIELLTRAYRMSGTGQGNSPFGSSLYYYPGMEMQLEQGEEPQIAGTLHAVLTRSGKLDETLERMAQQSAADPSDTRLAKLLIGLQTRSRRWDDLGKSLAAWRAARPDDLPLKLEELHAIEQAGDWSAAAELIERLKLEAPRGAEQWRIQEAFVHLMAGAPDKAVAAIEPALATVTSGAAADSGPVRPQALWTVLVHAKRFDRLVEHLEKVRRSDGSLDEQANDLLIRGYEALGRWQDAFATSAESLWRQQVVLSAANPWYRAVQRVVRRASESGSPVVPAPDRPQDAALVSLVSEGAAAGRDAFASAIAAGSDSLDLRRGLLLAEAMLAREGPADADAQLAANERVLEWLDPRRRDAWQWQPAPSLRDLALAHIRQIASGGATSLAFGGGASMLDSGLSNQLQGASAVTFEELWRNHALLERDLVARSGDVPRLRELLRGQKWSFAVGRRADVLARNANSWGYDNDSQRLANEVAALSDPDPLVRTLLLRNARFAELYEEVRGAGADVPSSQWPIAGDAGAVAGDSVLATERRRAAARLAIASMLATDGPSFGQGNRWMYRWYWYGTSTQEVQQVRSALRTASVDDVPEDPERRANGVRGVPDELWEQALLDPDVAAALESCAPLIGPGWELSRTLQQLVRYHDARGEPRRIVELIERVYGDDARLRPELLDSYVRACFQARDFERIERLLARAIDFSSSLESDVATLRLVALRQQGKSAEADALEAELLARCVREMPTPVPTDAAFVDAPGSSAEGPRAGQPGRGVYRNGRWVQEGPAFTEPVLLAPQLAQAIGVRFQPRVAEDDLTVDRLMQAYRAHGLHAHAARLLEGMIADAPTRSRKIERQALLVDLRRRSGDAEGLRTAAEAYVKALEEAIAADPGDASLLVRLGRFRSSEAGGRDYAGARNAFQQARRIDAAADLDGLLAVESLHKEGRHAEAWRAYDTALRNGVPEVLREPTLFHAALSAQQAGATDAAAPLLRLATYRYPTNVLASSAQGAGTEGER